MSIGSQAQPSPAATEGLEALHAIQDHSKEELVYRELRSAILSNRLRPGEKLMLRPLAVRFHVSTMPIRQALARLESEALVARETNGCLSVSPLSIKEAVDLIALRAQVESFAARLAAERLTDEQLDALAQMMEKMASLVAEGRVDELSGWNSRFHAAIYAAANVTHLLNILQNLRDLTLRYQAVYMHEPGVPAGTLEIHSQILAALQRRDAPRAEELVRRDMERMASVLSELIEKGEQGKEI